MEEPIFIFRSLRNPTESFAVFVADEQTNVILGACYIKICSGSYAKSQDSRVSEGREAEERQQHEERPAESLGERKEDMPLQTLIFG